jgi:hypothetical protein
MGRGIQMKPETVILKLKRFCFRLLPLFLQQKIFDKAMNKPLTDKDRELIDNELKKYWP